MSRSLPFSSRSPFLRAARSVGLWALRGGGQLPGGNALKGAGPCTQYVLVVSEPRQGSDDPPRRQRVLKDREGGRRFHQAQRPARNGPFCVPLVAKEGLFFWCVARTRVNAGIHFGTQRGPPNTSPSSSVDESRGRFSSECTLRAILDHFPSRERRPQLHHPIGLTHPSPI